MNSDQNMRREKNKMEEKTVSITAQVDEQLYSRFRKIAEISDVKLTNIINKGIGDYIGSYMNPSENYTFTPRKAYLMPNEDDIRDGIEGHRCVWLYDKRIGNGTYSKILIRGRDMTVPRNELYVSEDDSFDDVVRFVKEED